MPDFNEKMVDFRDVTRLNTLKIFKDTDATSHDIGIRFVLYSLLLCFLGSSPRSPAGCWTHTSNPCHHQEGAGSSCLHMTRWLGEAELQWDDPEADCYPAIEIILEGDGTQHYAQREREREDYTIS